MNYALFAAAVMFVLTASGCTGGTPTNYCDPGGPMPTFTFQNDGGTCVLHEKTECNGAYRVTDNCQNFSKEEKREAFDAYIQNYPVNNSLMGIFKNQDICSYCMNTSNDGCGFLDDMISTVC